VVLQTGIAQVNEAVLDNSFGCDKKPNPSWKLGKSRTIYRYGDIGITKALLAHNHGDILQLSSKTDKSSIHRASSDSIGGGGDPNRGAVSKQVSVQRLRLSVDPVPAPVAEEK
jgi:hypothetical protein